MEQIVEILNSIRPEFDFSASTDFVRDGMLDSFDMMMLVAELDKAFAISIEGTDIIPEHFSSIAAIRVLLAKYGKRV